MREVENSFTRFTRLPVQFPSPPRVFVSDGAPAAPARPFAGATCVPLLAEHQIKGILCAAFSTAAAQARCRPSTLFHLANHAVLIYQEVWRARNMAARRFLLAAHYPRRSVNAIGNAGPPRYLFVWPGLTSLTCVSLHTKFGYTKMSQLTGTPVVFSAEVSLEEIRDVIVYSEDIEIIGTQRATLGLARSGVISTAGGSQ